MKSSRPYFRKTDVLIILLVIITSITGFVFLCIGKSNSACASTAQIRVNAELTQEIDLTLVDTPYTMQINGNLEVTLEISREGVRFLSSACPDKLCVHQGLVGANESAACLPAGVSVSVTGTQNSEVDAVVG